MELTHFMEEHNVLVGQPHGEYLTHLTLQSGNTAAIGEAILEFSGKCNINDELKSLVAIQLMSILAACED